MTGFILSKAHLPDRQGLWDVRVSQDRIAEVAPHIAGAPRIDAGGGFLFSGYCEAHIHLDKALILDRCDMCAPSLASAVTETARVKAEATEEDVYERASIVLEKAISKGTTLMRSFVELDPRAGMRGFEALRRLRHDYAWALELQICAFAQEGLTNEPETFELLVHALESGANLIGGCPYRDPDPVAHIRHILDLAVRFDVDADFHIDFDLDPKGSDLPTLIAETERRGWQGRVVVGHATKLSAVSPDTVAQTASALAQAGIGVVALPATDLFLTGRDADHLVPRGVAPLEALSRAGVGTALASNNICNPFTPYGDANPLRMAKLYANVAHLASDEDMVSCFDRVSQGAARLIGCPQTLATGSPANLVLLEASCPAEAVRTLAQPKLGWFKGRPSFRRPSAELFFPGSSRSHRNDGK